jgi:hypothetical protein
MCISPLVDMADIATRLINQHRESLSPDSRALFDSLPGTLLQEALAVHSPLSYPVKVPYEGRLILAGVADEVIPSAQPTRLWQHWEHPRMHWISGDHLGHAIESTTFVALREFLKSLGLAHEQLLDIRYC